MCYRALSNKGRNKDVIEEAKLLIEQFTKDTDEIQADFCKAKESNQLCEIGKVQKRMDEVRELLDTQSVFIKLISRWFWYSMKKTIIAKFPSMSTEKFSETQSSCSK